MLITGPPRRSPEVRALAPKPGAVLRPLRQRKEREGPRGDCPPARLGDLLPAAPGCRAATWAVGRGSPRSPRAGPGQERFGGAVGCPPEAPATRQDSRGGGGHRGGEPRRRAGGTGAPGRHRAAGPGTSPGAPSPSFRGGGWARRSARPTGPRCPPSGRRGRRSARRGGGRGGAGARGRCARAEEPAPTARTQAQRGRGGGGGQRSPGPSLPRDLGGEHRGRPCPAAAAGRGVAAREGSRRSGPRPFCGDTGAGTGGFLPPSLPPRPPFP